MLHFKELKMAVAPNIRNQAMIHLEPAEVLSVLRAAKVKGAREWAMIVVAYKHGMRASEVCNLRLDDIDMKNGAIVVERLKGSLRTTQAVTEHRGEPLLNELKALREWLRQRPDDGSDYLFTSQKGGRLDRSQFFRLFQAIACEAGVPAEKQHPHALKFDCQSSGFCKRQSRLGETAAGSQIDWVDNALCEHKRPASL
jgi:type 1 fimbriae regulatory protein FimB